MDQRLETGRLRSMTGWWAERTRVHRYEALTGHNTININEFLFIGLFVTNVCPRLRIASLTIARSTRLFLGFGEGLEGRPSPSFEKASNERVGLGPTQPDCPSSLAIAWIPLLTVLDEV